jgi:hypothetical protein
MILFSPLTRGEIERGVLNRKRKSPLLSRKRGFFLFVPTVSAGFFTLYNSL